MEKSHIIGIVVIIAVIAAGACVTGGVTDNGEEITMDDFAKCLTSKGAAMYGADWCGHCRNQKKMFGDSFQYINYIECPQNQQLCREKGIRGYPTWIVNGQLLVGEQSLQSLASAAGCELPA